MFSRYSFWGIVTISQELNFNIYFLNWISESESVLFLDLYIDSILLLYNCRTFSMNFSKCGIGVNKLQYL